MGNQDQGRLLVAYLAGIRVVVEGWHTELTPEQRERVLDALTEERERGEPVETFFPGLWMAHCHIAEHHESGMMFGFEVVT